MSFNFSENFDKKYLHLCTFLNKQEPLMHTPSCPFTFTFGWIVSSTAPWCHWQCLEIDWFDSSLENSFVCSIRRISFHRLVHWTCHPTLAHCVHVIWLIQQPTGTVHYWCRNINTWDISHVYYSWNNNVNVNSSARALYIWYISLPSSAKQPNDQILGFRFSNRNDQFSNFSLDMNSDFT